MTIASTVLGCCYTIQPRNGIIAIVNQISSLCFFSHSLITSIKYINSNKIEPKNKVKKRAHRFTLKYLYSRIDMNAMTFTYTPS